MFCGVPSDKFLDFDFDDDSLWITEAADAVELWNGFMFIDNSIALYPLQFAICRANRR